MAKKLNRAVFFGEVRRRRLQSRSRPRANRTRLPLTADRLREVLKYDPESGDFLWLVKKGRCAAGSIAGCLNDKGYVIIEIDGIPHRSHRLAWLYVHGVWPPSKIDHRDLDKSNNRFRNLRCASPSQNCANTARKATNKSGVKGVCFDSSRGLWLAQIGKDRANHFLGRHMTKEAAGADYAEAAVRLFGEFARFA